MSQITNNTTALQSILETVNKLPEAGGTSGPFCVVSVKQDSANVVETVVNIGVGVSVLSYRIEYVVTEIEYSVHLVGWFISSSGVSTTTSAIVTYSFPVKNGATYTVTMTEIGSRLRRGLTTVDPSTITGNEGSIISDYVDDTSSNAVGYQFEYTATKDGWYLVYVSNQGERPVVSVVESVPTYIEE